MSGSPDGRRLRGGRGWVPFAMTPEWVLDAPISDRAKVLYAMLSRYADADSRAFPGRRRLAERLGVTLPTLDKALKELVDVDALSIVKRYRDDGGQTSNAYELHFAPRGQAEEGGGEPSPLSPKEREPEGTRDARTPDGVLAAQVANPDVPAAPFDSAKVALLDGRNLPFDAIADECGIDAKSPRGAEVAVALNGRRGHPELGIRRMFLLEIERWAAAGGVLDAVLAELAADPVRFEQGLARAVHDKAAKYREKMPPDSFITPTALAKYWLDLEQMQSRGGLTPGEMMRL